MIVLPLLLCRAGVARQCFLCDNVTLLSPLILGPLVRTMSVGLVAEEEPSRTCGSDP